MLSTACLHTTTTTVWHKKMRFVKNNVRNEKKIHTSPYYAHSKASGEEDTAKKKFLKHAHIVIKIFTQGSG